MADEFEFQAIPKFADFHSESGNLNSTIYFQKISSDHDLKSPARKPSTKGAAKVEKEQNHEPYDTAADKENVVNNVGASSKLALFNPAASRVAERARSRSQQIQVKPEEPIEQPKTARTRTPSSIPKLRSTPVPHNPRITKNSAADLRASSNLALFNPKASRIAEKIRRRSQQILAPPEEPPKEFRSTRTRTPSFIPKLRSSSIPRKLVVTADDADKQNIEKPKIRELKKAELFTPRAYKIPSSNAQIKSINQPFQIPKIRSSSIQRKPVVADSLDKKENVAKTKPEKMPEPSTRVLRSHRFSADTTPSKPLLTQANPLPIRQSSNRLRDAPLSKLRSSSIQRKPVHLPVNPSLTSTNPSPSSQRPSLRGVELNPRLRASVARLSTPRKRESIRLTK